MDKYVVVAPASADAQLPQDGRERLVARHVAAALEFGCTALIVNVLKADAGGPREEQPTMENEAPVLGATEFWVQDGRAVDPERFAGDWVYRVESHCPKSRERTWPLGAPSPGVKQIFGVRRKAPGREEFRRSWLEGHVPLAIRHHIGMCAYETDVVTEELASAPSFDGFSQLHFPSQEDFRERFYDDAEGRAAIEADVSGFVGSAVGWDVAEYVLIEPPRASLSI